MEEGSTRQADGAIPWLLDGDPAIRWQTLRDLVGAPADVVARNRSEVSRAGWASRLLALQDPDGNWGGGLYTPKWTSTTYSMLLLRDFGLPPDDPRAARACDQLLERGLRPDGGINFGRSDRGETCITGMVGAILAYFNCDDDRLDTILRHLLAQQMPDGGWNCRRPFGATHSSMHTTILALEGLRQYEQRHGGELQEVRAAQLRGQEFLLIHRLFRSDRTGEIIKPEFTRFSFQPRWHYDILRALDYLQSVRAPRDSRLEEAIGMVRGRRTEDGRWLLPQAHRGESFFQLESVGRPSRWNTLRALRVLAWWDSAVGRAPG